MVANKIRIAIGADHRGYELKESLKHLEQYAWFDVGTTSNQRTDYPLFAAVVVGMVLKGDVDCGVLICGSGSGMAIAANRHPGIYAAVAWNSDVARAIKADDNCNVLVLPSDFIDQTVATQLIDVWQKTAFKSGRYQERLFMIDAD